MAGTQPASFLSGHPEIAAASTRSLSAVEQLQLRLTVEQKQDLIAYLKSIRTWAWELHHDAHNRTTLSVLRRTLAVRFYERALGATVERMMRFDESPDPPPPGLVAPGFERKVMHASLRIGDSIVMASDGTSPAERSDHVSLALNCKTNTEVDRAFAALADGGQITMPLGTTFWSSYFGMLTDRIGWMVGIAAS